MVSGQSVTCSVVLIVRSRVFDQRLSPEPAYPNTIASLAETAYFAGKNGHTEHDAKYNPEQDPEILHAPPG